MSERPILASSVVIPKPDDQVPGLDLPQPQLGALAPNQIPKLKFRRASDSLDGRKLEVKLNKRATRRSITYIPTPRASRGFHQHRGAIVDEEFVEQIRQRRLQAEHGKGLKPLSMRLVAGLHGDDSYRRGSNAASSARYSFSRSMKKIRRRFRWHVSDLLEPIHPDGPVNHLREFLLLVVLGFQLVYIPFGPVYLVVSDPTTFQAINVAMELVLLVATLLGFNTAAFDKRQELLRARTDIAQRYVKGSFIPKLLGCFPLECITRLAQGPCPLILANKGAYVIGCVLRFIWIRELPRLSRSCWSRAIESVLTTTSKMWCGGQHALLSAVIKLFVKVLVLAHYLACILRCILNSPRMKAQTLSEITSDGTPVDIAALYTQDLLQVVLSLLGNGSEGGDTLVEAYSIFLSLVGVMMIAYITSQVAVQVLASAKTNGASCSDGSHTCSLQKSRWTSGDLLPVGVIEMTQATSRRRKSKLATLTAESESGTQSTGSFPSNQSHRRLDSTARSIDSKCTCNEVQSPALVDSEMMAEFGKAIRRMESKLDALALNDATTPRDTLLHTKSAPGSLIKAHLAQTQRCAKSPSTADDK